MIESTKKIISLLKKGHSQYEVHKMGFPWGTVRYQYQKLFEPKKHEQFLDKFREYRKKRYQEKKLSTRKSK